VLHSTEAMLTAEGFLSMGGVVTTSCVIPVANRIDGTSCEAIEGAEHWAALKGVGIEMQQDVAGRQGSRQQEASPSGVEESGIARQGETMAPVDLEAKAQPLITSFYCRKSCWLRGCYMHMLHYVMIRTVNDWVIYENMKTICTFWWCLNPEAKV
jgi:hypothetical protein